MRQILFIADDLGASSSINTAIFHAHRHGVLDGAAIMPGQPGTDAAIQRAREVGSLQTGWHVHLADSQPCTMEAWPWGRSIVRAGVALGVSPRARRLVRAELRAQWEILEQTGLQCRFVSGHHHLHIHPFVREVLLDILPESFTGWIRWGTPCYFDQGSAHIFHRSLDRILQKPHPWPFPTSTTLWGIGRTEAMRPDEIVAILPELGEGLHEFMFHPRRVDNDRDTQCLLDLRSLMSPAQADHHGAPRHDTIPALYN